MAKRDSQEVFEIGWYSGYNEACNEWKEKITDIKKAIVDEMVLPMADVGLRVALEIIDGYMRNDHE